MRATIVVEKWIHAIGWQYDKGFSSANEDLALNRARLMEGIGVAARVYRRTPEGPKVIYESPSKKEVR